jgi:hypothetical protein
VFPVGDNPATVALADFDNDGRVDIVTADGGAISFGVLVNTTPTGGQVATFRPQVAFTTTGAPVALAVGDFNADGKPDVAVATAGSIEVFINQTTDSVASGGTLSFSGPTVLTLGGALTAVAIGDVNGDSKPDIVATSAMAPRPTSPHMRLWRVSGGTAGGGGRTACSPAARWRRRLRHARRGRCSSTRCAACRRVRQ